MHTDLGIKQGHLQTAHRSSTGVNQEVNIYPKMCLTFCVGNLTA